MKLSCVPHTSKCVLFKIHKMSLKMGEDETAKLTDISFFFRWRALCRNSGRFFRHRSPHLEAEITNGAIRPQTLERASFRQFPWGWGSCLLFLPRICGWVHELRQGTGCPTSNLETLKAYILKSIWLKTKILGAMCVSWWYILFEIIKIFLKNFKKWP